MPVRFGLIGCGKIAERLALPQLRACEEARVTALVDINRVAAEQLAGQFGLDQGLIWTDWKRMLREAEVDAIGVCLPNWLHAEVSVACLEAGKHVMVEKPMALSLEEADAMIATAKRVGRKLMVEQTLRFDPMHEVARDVLCNGMIGSVRTMRGCLGNAGPEYWSQNSPWFTSKPKSGGGVLMDLGVHILDLMRWLSGQEVRRVCVVGKTLEKSIPIEDNTISLLEFENGAIGSVQASWTMRPYEVSTTFYGDRGTLKTLHGDPHPVTVQFCRLSDDPNGRFGPDYYPYVPQASRVGGSYASFVQSIAEGVESPVSGEEGRRTLEVVLAAYRSMETGGWVDLPLSAGRASGSRPRTRTRPSGKRS